MDSFFSIFILTLILANFCLLFVVAGIASSRGRSAIGWFFLALILSPYIAGLVVFLLKDKKQEAQDKKERKEDKEMQLKQFEILSKKSPSDELMKLAVLRDNGVITQEEFNIKKSSLLWA